MNEKRFKLRLSKLGNGMITDNQKREDLFFDKEFLDVTLTKATEWLNKFAEDNEQLQQRNDRQAKQLDRLYRLIEEKDWRALSDIIDDFKRCEEQLQRESGTYGDVETEKRSCGHCKYLQIDGMFGMWCDKGRNWKDTDADYCSDYER